MLSVGNGVCALAFGVCTKETVEKAKSPPRSRILLVWRGMGVVLPLLLFLRGLPSRQPMKQDSPRNSFWFFFVLCGACGWLVCYAIREWDSYRGLAGCSVLMIGGSSFSSTLLLKGFSLRGLSAVSLGLGLGTF